MSLIEYEGQTGLADIESARLALELIVEVDDARDLANRAASAADYFKRARETRHLANRATEIRIWAERRAGRLLLDEGISDENRGVRAKEIGTTGSVLKRWLAFARADERSISNVVAEVAREGDLTVNGVARRLACHKLTRVERGIFENYLGHFVLRWRDRGVTRTKTMPGSLQQAREELLIVTGKATRPRDPADTRRDVTHKERVQIAYGNVRRTLQLVDEISASNPESRLELVEAVAALHRAEDALGRTLRLW